MMPNCNDDEALELIKQGRNHIEKSNYGLAIECFEQVTKCSENNMLRVKAYIGLSETYLKLGNYMGAKENIQKAIDNNPETAEDWEDIALLFEELGKKTDDINLKKFAVESHLKSAKLGNIKAGEYVLECIDKLKAELVWKARSSIGVYGDAPIHRAKRQRDEAEAESRVKDEIINILKDLCESIIKVCKKPNN